MEKIQIYKYASKANIIKEVEESLKRLQTNYIDLLQIHWPDSTTPIQETMEALELLIQQGKSEQPELVITIQHKLKKHKKQFN